MSQTKIKTRIQHKHDYEHNWLKAVNFIPLPGELIVYDAETAAMFDPSDTENYIGVDNIDAYLGRTTPILYARTKFGDGVHTVSELPFSCTPALTYGGRITSEYGFMTMFDSSPAWKERVGTSPIEFVSEDGDKAYYSDGAIYVPVPEQFYFIVDTSYSLEEKYLPTNSTLEPLISGDWLAVVNGCWMKIDNTETIHSVNGQVGDVVINTDKDWNQTNPDAEDFIKNKTHGLERGELTETKTYKEAQSTGQLYCNIRSDAQNISLTDAIIELSPEETVTNITLHKNSITDLIVGTSAELGEYTVTNTSTGQSSSHIIVGNYDYDGEWVELGLYISSTNNEHKISKATLQYSYTGNVVKQLDAKFIPIAPYSFEQDDEGKIRSATHYSYENPSYEFLRGSWFTVWSDSTDNFVLTGPDKIEHQLSPNTEYQIVYSGFRADTFNATTNELGELLNVEPYEDHGVALSVYSSGNIRLNCYYGEPSQEDPLTIIITGPISEVKQLDSKYVPLASYSLESDQKGQIRSATHYEDPEVVLLDTVYITESGFTTPEGEYKLTSPIKVGHSYKIELDGQSAQFTASDSYISVHNVIALPNWYMYIDGDTVVIEDSDFWYYGGTVSCKISELNVVKQLDTKYIPVDNETIITDNNGKLKASLPQVDWSQYDVQASDYIKNRTHYDSSKIFYLENIDEYVNPYYTGYDKLSLIITDEGYFVPGVYTVSNWDDSFSGPNPLTEIVYEGEKKRSLLDGRIEYIFDVDEAGETRSQLRVIPANNGKATLEVYSLLKQLDPKFIPVDNNTIKVNSSGKLVANVSVPDTKNTAGATNTSNKIYLVGAESQSESPETYTHDTAYVGKDGCLYSDNKKVVTGPELFDENSKIKASLFPDIILGQMKFGGILPNIEPPELEPNMFPVNYSVLLEETIKNYITEHKPSGYPVERLDWINSVYLIEDGAASAPMIAVNYNYISEDSESNSITGNIDIYIDIPEGFYFISNSEHLATRPIGMSGNTLHVGDWLVSVGAIDSGNATWEVICNTDTVRTVNNKIGDVTLTANDVGAYTKQETDDLFTNIKTTEVKATGILRTYSGIRVGGDGSVKIGGQNSFTVGIGSNIDISSAKKTVAIGNNLKAAGDTQFIIGENHYNTDNNINGKFNIIHGDTSGCNITGNYNALLASGGDNEITTQHNLVVGARNSITGTSTDGDSLIDNGEGNLVIGVDNKIDKANYSGFIGRGLVSSSTAQVVVGQYNEATDDAFIVGCGDRFGNDECISNSEIYIRVSSDGDLGTEITGNFSTELTLDASAEYYVIHPEHPFAVSYSESFYIRKDIISKEWRLVSGTDCFELRHEHDNIYTFICVDPEFYTARFGNEFGTYYFRVWKVAPSRKNAFTISKTGKATFNGEITAKKANFYSTVVDGKFTSKAHGLNVEDSRGTNDVGSENIVVGYNNTTIRGNGGEGDQRIKDSILVGRGLQGSGYYQMVLGQYNDAANDVIDAPLIIGWGTETAKKTIFTVKNDGEVVTNKINVKEVVADNIKTTSSITIDNSIAQINLGNNQIYGEDGGLTIGRVSGGITLNGTISAPDQYPEDNDHVATKGYVDNVHNTLFDENNKVKASLFPDIILGQMKFGGVLNTYAIDDPYIEFTPSTAVDDYIKASVVLPEDRYLDAYYIIDLSFQKPTIRAVSYAVTGGEDDYHLIDIPEGFYFISNVEPFTDWEHITHGGFTTQNGKTVLQGDWLVVSNNQWEVVDNTDAVRTVKGIANQEVSGTGNIILTANDVGAYTKDEVDAKYGINPTFSGSIKIGNTTLTEQQLQKIINLIDTIADEEI